MREILLKISRERSSKYQHDIILLIRSINNGMSLGTDFRRKNQYISQDILTSSSRSKRPYEVQ